MPKVHGEYCIPYSQDNVSRSLVLLSWVAFNELKRTHHNKEALLSSIYPYCGNLV